MGNKITLKLAITLIWLFFCYIPKIKLDMQDTYTISGVLEKQTHGRSIDYVIRVPNPHKNKTVFDHDVYKYPWFFYGYSYFGAENQSFCENAETLGIIRDKAPVQVLFAKNVGGFFRHAYMVVEVKRDGTTIECYSKEDTLKRYNQIWLRNFSFISICFTFFGLIVIWYPKFFRFLNINRDK